MCEIAKNYFENLFTAKECTYDSVLKFIQPSIMLEDNEKLLRPVLKDDLHEALLEMHPDKPPGPDGFNPTFYQKLWGTCSDDIFNAVKHWLDMDFFPPSLSKMNIYLISKCIKPHNVKDL